ncbi:hypothetical protein SAY87_028051 [Trapa incisa]|uniref:Homeobox domain-containing protein n=1 Tax=Trapa incisa TaxID=236973 RepID=A0AAN7L1W8_9MYRT|nr:hypothetical protein SAY87_028051 [Trapa incisa]
MGIDDICHTSLTLGLGFIAPADDPVPAGKGEPGNCTVKRTPRARPGVTAVEPYLTLALSRESYDVGGVPKTAVAPSDGNSSDQGEGRRRHSSPHSTVSSFSSQRVKRERYLSSSEEVEAEPLKAADEDDSGGISRRRKKLRLSKEQSALLEESFKRRSTLNPKQKQALSRQLNLRPRQVEVWFQNRRARTKLKKTEVECEILKKCCETLKDENRRLQKELHQLKTLQLAQPCQLHMSGRATLNVCPSCQRVDSKSPFSMTPKAHTHNRMSNPSTAC